MTAVAFAVLDWEVRAVYPQIDKLQMDDYAGNFSTKQASAILRIPAETAALQPCALRESSA